MILTNEWDQHNGFRHKIENIFWFLSYPEPEDNAAYTELKRRKPVCRIHIILIWIRIRIRGSASVFMDPDSAPDTDPDPR